MRGHGAEAAARVRFRARVRIHCPAVVVVGIPNAGKRGPWAVAQVKQEGLQPGFPDDLCLWPGGGCCFIEWKAAGGRLSPNQREWQDRLTSLGFACAVCSDPDEGLAFLRELGAPFLQERAA